MRPAVKIYGALLLLCLVTGSRAVDPEDPDDVAPVQIMLCGSDAIDALFSSSQMVRRTLITDWGRGIYNFTSSLEGVKGFVDGTCDLIINIGPLSESQAAPLVRDQNRTIMQIPFAVGSARLVHSWRSWGGAGQPLYMTPDILASIYQCNITFLDDPSIQAMNPNLSLPHTPLHPLAGSGSAEASILFRHLATLASNWRLGTDQNVTLPPCVQPSATYADFLRDDTFYIGLTRQASQLWALPSVVVLENVSNTTDDDETIDAPLVDPPDGSDVAEWSAFSPVGRTAGFNARKERELMSWDHFIFLVYDQDSVSRGYPVGSQITQLGRLLLSDNIQSQLPAYNFQPLSSLNLVPSALPGYLEDVQSIKCKCKPDMPYTFDASSSQLVIRGQPTFNALMFNKLKGYPQNSMAWEPFMEYANTIDTFRYPKKLAHMLMMDDPVMPEVLATKDRVGESLMQVPFAMDAAIMAHSVPGIKYDELCMDAETIADILQCRITIWDHPNITALNPGISLPAQPINVTIDPVNLAVVHAIAKYLTRLAPGWELGNDYIVQWPSCTHLMNSLYGHTNQSRPFETNYTFGYQQLSAYRIDEPGQAIRIVNAHGNCVSGLNISASSLNSINISAVAPQQWHNFTWYYSNAPDVYPLGMMGFLLWDANSTDIGYDEGRLLKNVTSMLLSPSVQQSMFADGLIPTYQNASAQVQQTIVQATPDTSSKPAGIPFNWTVTGCSSANGYNAFEAILWKDLESSQGRPFLLDTMYASDTEVLHAFLSSSPERGERCDFALVWDPMSAKDLANAPRRVLHIPIGFAPLPIIHNFEGIPDNALRLDAHALAGLYSCKIRTFDGYIQALNPNLTLPGGNITVIAMPRSGSSAQHLISYIRQDPLWDAELDGSPTWPDCVWTTKVKPYSGRISQLMLEHPNSTIGFQPVGHYLTIRILTRMAEGQAANPQRAYAVQDPLASVWNKVLNGMWSTNSALPVERSVRVRNDKDMYLAAQPVDDVDFPWDMNDLPDNFRSPAWTTVTDPVHNTAVNSYPIGQMMWVVADENIGGKGVIHAKRMKSFLRFLQTGKSRSQRQQPADDGSEDAEYQKALGHVNTVKHLPPDLMAWALAGITNLSYDPLPPLPNSAHAPSSNRPVSTILHAELSGGISLLKHVIIGVAIAVAVLAGLLTAAFFIWRRQYRIQNSSFRSTLAGLEMRSSISGLSDTSTNDLKLELDGKGEPVMLGQGSYGRVYKGRWNGVLVAVKVLNTSTEEVMEDFQRECAILERLRHPNIIKYFGSASNAEGQVMMVTEYMQGGDLGLALAKDTPSNRRLSWYNSGSHIALCIARGLAYLHAQKVISFDVKPANVLLDRTGKGAKLADVGLAKVLEHSQTMTNMRGTLDYMPPEMFRSYEEEEDGGGSQKQAVTQAVDIYSFGLVVWQLVTGEQLDKFQGSLRQPRVPEECPEQIAQLYVACLSEEPGQRPKAADLVKIITAAQEAALKRSLSSRLTGRGSRLWPSRHGGSS